MTDLRSGFTTGTCAAAAAKAATMLLCGQPAQETIEVALPDGERVRLPILLARRTEDGAEATVRKDAGDDPDVTDGATVVASVRWSDNGDVTFAAGEGVGTVTKPGLSIPPGEPAINPVPRNMIRSAVREVTDRGVKVTISIPDGRELAEKTFNPRLGVEGGLSILGTTGRVRPFSCPALREALRCALDVAVACGIRSPVLVPGHIGERAARRRFLLVPEQVIEVSNEWGFILDQIAGRSLDRLLVLGHPGKLAKLSVGQWDTHSSRSESATPVVAELAGEVLGRSLPESKTTEGLFADLPPGNQRQVADALSEKVRRAVAGRLGNRLDVSVVLVNMKGDLLGSSGDLAPWQ
ncbi:MAG: cobalt-precorrin-5B (C(1))-methyltransferase CbiD [Planctomycetota bacterium]